MGIGEPLLLAISRGVESSGKQIQIQIHVQIQIQIQTQIQIQKFQMRKYSPIPVGLNQLVGKLAGRRTISRWIGSRATRFMPESKGSCRLVGI